MSNYTPTGNLRTTSQFEAEFTKISEAIEDKLDRNPDVGQANQMNTTLDMNSNRGINALDPVNPLDLVNKRYVDRQLTNVSLDETATLVNVGSPRDFGAVGDGVTDDTSAVQAALDALDVTYIDRSYAVTSTITISKYATCLTSGEIVWAGAAANPTPVVVALETPTFGVIKVDGALGEVRCVAGSQTIDRVGERIETRRVRASDSTKNVSAGVLISSGTLTLTSAKGTDLLNAGHSNDSFPQFLVSSTVGTEIRVNTVECRDSQSGVVSSGGDIFADKVTLDTLDDNGVYSLGGNVFISDLYAKDIPDEIVVNQAGCYIGNITAVGFCGSVLRIQNAEVTHIGNITSTYPWLWAATEFSLATIRSQIPRNLFGNRTGNTASGDVRIGSVQGHFGESLVRTGFGSGTVSNFDIGSMDVRLYWVDTDVDSRWDRNNWFHFGGVQKYKIEDCNVDIIDINNALDGSQLFTSQWGNPTGESLVENLRVYILDNTLNNSTSGSQFRGNEQQENLRINGAVWATVGGVTKMREANIGPPDSFTNSTQPGTGYWFQGQTFRNIEWNGSTVITYTVNCTTAGTAGSGAVFTNVNIP